MKVAYFIIQPPDPSALGSSPGPTHALEEGAVLNVKSLVREQVRIISFKDRLAAHNREAKKTGGTPRFSDPEKYLLWLHQNGETIYYVRAPKTPESAATTA
jgi:hypothetical protein